VERFGNSKRLLMYRFQHQLKNFKQKSQDLEPNKFWEHLKSATRPRDNNEKCPTTIDSEGRKENLVEEEKWLEQLLMERATQEETYWRQKSHIQWLKEGERNTNFFHTSTIKQR
jgi:hypothetical protein